MASSNAAGSARYFCSILDEMPRIYVSALALDIKGAGEGESEGCPFPGGGYLNTVVRERSTTSKQIT